MGARLSFAELRRVADEAAEREDRLEQAYGRLPCPMLVVLAGKADPVPHGEAMLAAVDTAATRLQQLHPVQLEREFLPGRVSVVPLDHRGEGVTEGVLIRARARPGIAPPETFSFSLGMPSRSRQ